jgi:ubiquinone biosynthesis protein
MNLVFLDGAIATLAPDLDLIAEVGAISLYFANTHGERLGRELGIDHRTVEIDLDGFKASLGVDASTEGLTYRQLQERRALINKRMRERAGR